MSMVDLPKLIASGDEQVDWMRVRTVFKWPSSDPRRIFSLLQINHTGGSTTLSFQLLITNQ